MARCDGSRVTIIANQVASEIVPHMLTHRPGQHPSGMRRVFRAAHRWCAADGDHRLMALSPSETKPRRPVASGPSGSWVPEGHILRSPLVG